MVTNAADDPLLSHDLPCERVSPNVWRVIAFSFLANLSTAIWQSSVWSPFLKHAFHSNIYLGCIAAAGGIGELLAACVSGFGADRFGKERFVRLASCMCLVAIALVALGVEYEHLATLIIASAASGASYGAFFPCVEGIFADSVPSGRRTFVYNVKYGLETISYIIGYSVTLILFAVVGDEWHVSTMKIVIFIGLGLQACASLLLWTIREKHTLTAVQRVTNDAAANINDAPPRIGEQTDHEETADGDDDDEDEDEGGAVYCCSAAQGSDGRRGRRWLTPQRYVALVVALRDTIVCLGSGMTVMYFVLFLIDDYGVTPMTLQGILMGCSAVAVLFSQTMASVVGDSGRCATADGVPRFNRIRVLLVPLAVGIAGIAFLAFARGPAAIAGLVFPIYIIRSAAMNCSSGVSRAILMDLVPTKQRAKWNIFESLANISWAGSAVVGGAVADRWGYRATFVVTGCFHVLAFIVLSSAARFSDRKPSKR
jgi:MFS family permease